MPRDNNVYFVFMAALTVFDIPGPYQRQLWRSLEMQHPEYGQIKQLKWRTV